MRIYDYQNYNIWRDAACEAGKIVIYTISETVAKILL